MGCTGCGQGTGTLRDPIHSETATCEFEQINRFEVRCIFCGRSLSGTPERYKDKMICDAKLDGPGTELEKIFKWWGKRLGIDYTPCSRCKNLRREMDVRGKEWVRNNVDGLAAQIKRNAKAQGINVPEKMVKHWLMKVSK